MFSYHPDVGLGHCQVNVVTFKEKLYVRRDRVGIEMVL